jgi:hypothetical protein
MALDMTTFDAALKDYYTDDVVQNMVYKKNPLLALLPKMKEFYGRRLPIPIIYGNPQGRSATFTRAQTRGQLENSRVESFDLTRVKDYGIATIDNETMEASKNDAGAFLKAATTEIDGIINSLTRSLAIAQYKAGFGAIGTIATSSFGVTTLTLNQIEDITNFEVGQELDLATTEAGSTLKAYGSSGNGLIVTGVNRSLGTLSFAFNVNDATNGIPTIAQNDFIFIRGDRQNSATPARTKIAGLDAWLPYTSPTSASFFGVDRTVDVTRLGGQRLDGTAMPIEEALITLAVLIAREGGAPDHCFLNYSKYADLEKALGSKVQYVDLKVGEIGFRGIRVNGPNGEINIIPDQNCPLNRAYMLQLDTWQHCSLGEPVRVIDTDGLKMLRQAGADGVEVRYGYYANLGCSAPGWNGVVAL